MPSLSHKHKALFERYAFHRPSLSAYSFSHIFLWSDCFEFDFQVIAQCLCVWAKNSLGIFLYLPPLGQNPQAALEECFRFMERENGVGAMCRVEHVACDDLNLFSPEEFVYYEKGMEYGYRRTAIGALLGNAYKSKRWAYNHFVKHNDYEYRPFDPAMREECLLLYDDWAKNRRRVYREEVYNQMLDDSRMALSRALGDFDHGGLIGRVIRVDGKIKAMTFGYPLTPEVFCVAFEIADLNRKGITSAIFRKFCQDPAIHSYELINAMDDFGLENMTVVKESFRPAVRWPVYGVKRKPVSGYPDTRLSGI